MKGVSVSSVLLVFSEFRRHILKRHIVIAVIKTITIQAYLEALNDVIREITQIWRRN